MSIRLNLGQFLLNVSYFLRRIYIVVLRPRDLIESNRLQYKTGSNLRRFSGQDLFLTQEEKGILDKYGIKKGRFLVLACGGGRESIALTRLGFDVLGVDFVKEMIDCARANAEKFNLAVEFQLQDMTRLNLTQRSFDYAGLFYGLYSTIPSRSLRVEFLRKIKVILKPGGFFIGSFFIRDNARSPKINNNLKIISYLTFGNTGVQPGDELSPTNEFMHYFHDRQEAYSEFEEAGLRIEEIVTPEVCGFSYAVAKA